MFMYSVTFTHKYENAQEYQPRTAIFTTYEKAELFLNRVMSMHDQRDQDYLMATIDCYTPDSDVYFTLFDAEMRD